jgi:hypothetical protein
MQVRYVLMRLKDGVMDAKNTRCFESKAKLDAVFEAEKEKFNAIELPEKETRSGPLGTTGLFKFAEGKCKHGQKVELEYSEISEMPVCFKQKIKR